MYINSKHLQIFNLIKNNQNFNLNDISKIFNISPQRTKIYIQDIYSEFYQYNFDKQKTVSMIKEIQNFKNGKNVLRRAQVFTKDENIFYIIFHLAIEGHFKMSEISKDISITSRNLNNYTAKIQDVLMFFNLTVSTSNTGIKLIGSKYGIQRLQFFLYLKFLIEKNYLPKEIRKKIFQYFEVQNFSSFKREIAQISQFFKSDNLMFSKKILVAFYFVFKSKNTNKKIKDIHPSGAFKYCTKMSDKKFILDILKILKTENFGNLPAMHFTSLISIMTQSFYSGCFLNKTIVPIQEELNAIFSEHLGETQNLKFNTILKSAIFYCKSKEILFIDDTFFLELNLDFIPNSNFLELTKEIQKKLPRFTIFECLMLWYSFNESDLKLEKNIFVYKNLSSNIISNLVKEVEKKNDTIINNSVNLLNLNSFLKTNDVDNIFIIENLNLKFDYISVKKVFIPFQKFKKNF
ncbi:MAG: hypothetical protein ACRCYT_07120 [Cetobacterium sp.]